jgi:hypothetical protein
VIELTSKTLVDDLTKIGELDTTAVSGTAPGAAILMNPYVAAARFVLAGQDIERNVKQTAGKIAADVAARASAASAPAR